MAYNQNFEFNGLGTLSVTVPEASPYFVDGHISLPTIAKGDSANSAALVTISKNGTPFYTGQAGAEGFYATVTCAALDVIAIAFSSSAAVDQGLNVIRSVISIGEGQ